MTKKKYVPYLMIAPFFLIYFTFSLFPILYSLAVSFTDWGIAGASQFVGIDNYIRLFQDKNFIKAIGNTLLFMAVALPIELTLGMFMAVFLKDFVNKTRPVFQLLNFLPYITAPVAMGMLFQLLFDYNNGTVNQILIACGIIEEPIYWLGFPLTAKIVVIVLIIWRLYGYMMVMFLTGLSTIPSELYEAAKVDGASWFHSFRTITIPLLKPIVIFVVTMSTISGWKLFDEARLLFQGDNLPSAGPENSILTMVMYFYDTAFNRFEFAYGSSMGYVLFFIIAVFSFVFMKITNRGERND